MSESKNEIKLKDIVSGKVSKITLSGALVDIGRSKPAVIPISQLKKEKVKRVQDVVEEGQEISAWVRRLDEKLDRVELTLIEPLTLEWRDIKAGMKVSGKVEKLENFGAFVNIGSERPGLVHVSELSHDYVRNPQDVVSVGAEVEAQILAVDRKKKQIKLSLKALQDDPKALMVEEIEEDNEPTLTAMESALRKAMDASESGDPAANESTKKSKKESGMEDILARTLEHRASTK
jgi:ribosomal protein S1